MRYINSVRFSEQMRSSAVANDADAAGRNDALHRRPPMSAASAQGHSRERLVECADRVQAAVYALIRGYETTTGHSVIRLDYDAEARRITLDALPLSK
jgi:hypothetical protein